MGMRDFYEKITEVQDEIRIFEQSLSSRVSEEDIAHKLLSLCSNVEIPINIVNWQSGTKFYRARILNNNNLNQLKQWSKSDFWSLPENNVNKYGRLNHINESVLYLSNDINQTLTEVRFNPREKIPVVISCFEAKQSFGSVHIGGDGPKDSSENGLTIPLMFNEKYQLCLSNNEVINSIFNLRFQA